MNGHHIDAQCQRWDERYRQHESFFGSAPTPAVADAVTTDGFDPGDRALCLGEGEGRDAVFLARAGLDVTAVDGSAVGLQRMCARATAAGVQVEAVRADLGRYVIAARAYALICCVYCHLPPVERRRMLRGAARGLAPGGVLLVEGFSPRQRSTGRISGGPRELQLLFTAADVRSEIGDIVDVELAWEGEQDIDFGRHRGSAFVTRVRGRGR